MPAAHVRRLGHEPNLDERPPSLLRMRRIEPSIIALGAFFAVAAHLLIPAILLASQWLLVLLGLAVPVGERERPKPPIDVIAAEFVKLGKPFDPRKLPSRQVPKMAKRKTDAVTVSKDPKEQPPPKEEEKKPKPKESKESLLDNLVDRTEDFAEDVEHEQEGDPEGIAEGTSKVAKLGDLYQGKLKVFFQKGWSVPNVVQNVEKLEAIAGVQLSSEGLLEAVSIQKSSGDPLFDQSVLDAVTALIDVKATIPEPPPELAANYYGKTLGVRFRGSEAR
ncbi:MAG: TonB C-terminal domain-containing protein [Polyangiales bacterium]